MTDYKVFSLLTPADGASAVSHCIVTIQPLAAERHLADFPDGRTIMREAASPAAAVGPVRVDAACRENHKTMSPYTSIRTYKWQCTGPSVVNVCVCVCVLM